jgi:HAD superfamily hydrolase (TIGR01509 family)
MSASWPPPRSNADRAFVFDLDGTLVDSRRAIVDAVQAGIRDVLVRHGVLDETIDSQRIETAMGLPSDLYYRAVLPDRLVHLAVEVQAAATRREVEALERGEGRLFPGVNATLQALSGRGAKIAIVSNAQAPYFRAALRALDLGRWTSFSECFEELPRELARRPKQALLTRALAALRVEAHDSLMVGDRREDILAGRELGCRTVGMTYGFGSSEELERATWKLDRFEDLLHL